jgi:DNA repair protein RadC
MQKVSIKDWALQDRPREKLIAKGKSALSDAELLAILIGSGNRFESAVDLSKRILAEAGNKLASLGRLNLRELMEYNGIGEAKALTVIAAVELSRRRVLEPALAKAVIGGSKDIFNLFHPILGELNVEEFWMVTLTSGNTIIDKYLVSRGGVGATIADPKIIFKHAVQSLATGIVVLHNHPSDNLKPSRADMQLTRQLVESGKLLDVKVLDHLIIGASGYYSFADQGQL